MAGKVQVIDHPLIQHKLSLMRRKGTSTCNFRSLLQEISMLMAYEVCRDMPTHCSSRSPSLLSVAGVCGESGRRFRLSSTERNCLAS